MGQTHTQDNDVAENLRILTFSNTLFAKMVENGESIAVFRVLGKLEPVTLVFMNEESLERQLGQFPDTLIIGYADYRDIEMGYEASALADNGLDNREKVKNYLDQKHSSVFMLDKMSIFLGNFLGEKLTQADKKEVANNTPKDPQLN